ncbi:unnamed protein product [Periconia digitata]|uniref:Extracellular mutant protein 11 C-terminal domain-containing protein n=1 Tax=Periconia digitata TaxID=1303443 RepID=A0A9W4XTX2_9PLEO|nr:unnamed protein product [Periconia digitata]
MTNFAKGRGRMNVASPQLEPQQQAPAPSRAQIGARLKAAVPRDPLRHPQQQQQQQQYAEPNGQHENNTARMTPQPHHRLSGDSRNGKRDVDRYDTDADSIDTSTLHGSVVQASNNQHLPPQQDLDQQIKQGENEYEEYETEVSDDEEDTPEDDENHSGEPEHTGGFFGGGDSYPSTTSGPPEDTVNWGTGVKQEMTQDHKQPSADFFQHPPNSHRPGFQQKLPVPERNLFATTAQAPPKPNIYEKGRTLHIAHKNNSIGANVGRAGIQPSSNTQATREPAQGSMVIRSQAPQSSTLPERGLRSLQGQTSASVQTSVPAPPPPVSAQQITTKIRTEEELKHGPNEDYDRETLYKMDYASLKNESFDKPPRPLPQVLSEDMQKKPLPDRLQHVFEKLGEEDHVKFVESLTMDDWEDAGQWFVNQFSGIMQRTTNLRKQKRKVAREFEDQVEKRYRYVEKRQKVVEDALSMMQQRGENLVPRTPRASREPRNV